MKVYLDYSTAKKKMNLQLLPTIIFHKAVRSKYHVFDFYKLLVDLIIWRGILKINICHVLEIDKNVTFGLTCAIKKIVLVTPLNRKLLYETKRLKTERPKF